MEAESPAIRPSSQNGDAPFQRRNAARQAAAVRGRAQRKSNLPAHMEQYMWNRGDADKSRFRA